MGSFKRLFLIFLAVLALALVNACSSSEETPPKVEKASDMEERSESQVASLEEDEDEETITEADVIDITAGIDQAVSNMDVEDLREYLSPSAKITISLQGRTENFKVDKYLEYLEKGWSKVSEYDYERLDEEITIGPGGRSAVVEADVTESMVMNGKNITIAWREKIIVGIVNGEVLVTKASSVAQ